MTVGSLTPGTFTTLHVRPPKGMRGKWSYISGTVLDVTDRTVTIEHTSYDAWHGTEHKRAVTIERWRIR